MSKARYQNLIAQQRVYPHKVLPQAFCLRDKTRFLAHYYNLLALTMTLAEQFDARDKPLLKKILHEYERCHEQWLDVRDEVALCAMLLYRHMDWRDVRSLYRAKFCSGGDTFFSLDIELVFGFDAKETIAYLKKLPKKQRKPIDREIIRAIEHYLNQPDAVYRNRAEYLRRMDEKGLIAYRCGELWEIYGDELAGLLNDKAA